MLRMPNMTSNLFVTALSCSLVGQTMEVRGGGGSRAAQICGSLCHGTTLLQFRAEPGSPTRLHEAGLRIVDADTNGEARIMTIPQQPFFIVTLVLPQLTSISTACTRSSRPSSGRR
jgi:hypothetical protein